MSGVSPNEGDPRQLLRFACTELQRRLQAGEPCSAEQLLAEFPDLASHEELVLDLVCSEYELRILRGEKPTAAEWYARFPQWRERLQGRLRVEAGVNESQRIGDETVPEVRASPDPPPTSSPGTAWQAFAHYRLQEE